MDELFVKEKLQHTLSISPEDINNKIDDILSQKLAEEIEGKCIKDGYVKTGSVNIVDRSLGEVLIGHFTGDMIYNIVYTVDICNPLEGSVIPAKVVNINKMGVLANAGEGVPPPLHILLAKQHHIDNEQFEALEEGMEISVKILGKRYEYGDNQISIIATLDSLTAKKKKVRKIIKKKKVAEVPDDNDEDETEEEEPIYFDSTSPETMYLSSFNNGNPFSYNGRRYDTVTHAYEAQKLDGDDDTANNYRDLLTVGKDTYIGNDPNTAENLGSKKSFDKINIKIRPDWHKVREIILKQILIEYYNSNEDLKVKLIETGNRELIFTGKNDHWGVVGKKNEGQNIYGKMLMELREEFKLN